MILNVRAELGRESVVVFLQERIPQDQYASKAHCQLCLPRIASCAPPEAKLLHDTLHLFTDLQVKLFLAFRIRYLASTSCHALHCQIV